MGEFRCELLSADQLALLASGPLPRGIPADPARRSLHRDMYLDTSDDVLRQRGIVCRFRADADGNGSLVLRITQPNGNGPLRVESPTRAVDAAGALSENTAVVRRLRGLVDPRSLVVRTDLEVDRLSRSAARDWLRRPKLEVHLDRVTIRWNGTSASFLQLCAHQFRGDGDEELLSLQRAIEEEHGLRASRVTARERAELAMKWSRLEGVPRTRAYSDHLHRVAVTLETAAIPEFLNAELSLLSFQRRVLALAADTKTPLRERLRFLSIVSANVDEFFMVRMAGLYADAVSPAAATNNVNDSSGDGLDPAEELDAVLASVAEISSRQSDCAEQCLSELAEHGIHVTSWASLGAEQRATLRARFREEIQPLLTPFAMTLSPGHPLPRLMHLSLGIATIFRSGTEGLPRFSEVDLPATLPRFFSIPDRRGQAIVPLEEIVRANLDLVHPGMTLDQAYVFRVTRSAELELDELHADDLLSEVERATARRDQGTAVRLEVERGMPPVLRSLLLEDLRRERGDAGPLIPDVEEVDGLLDLRGLAQIEIPAGGTLSYPPLRSARRLATGPMFELIARGDVVVHHPFDSFDDSVVRFIREAAEDPDTLGIKITLYRIGNPSPIAEALVEAARAGKQVAAFVELKARFDEDINIGWSRALESAGGHVVRGLVGLKNHAKVTLVVRRESGGIKQYAHIGTGNYNVRSGAQYTDLSLFTCDADITADVADLFNELTGSSEAPQRQPRALLVAPRHLLPGILQRIEREAAHARAGHEARITAKLNGLSDPDIVRALYRASRDGVEVDLIVRGICTLRPGVARRSDRIRVTSVVGRFLEHSRIYRFLNAGSPEYFIGSADLRPRNLRRRVEVLAPIRAAAHRQTIDRILDAYLNDPTAWELAVNGEYTKRSGAGKAAQELAEGW
jgi:polyphosphate kinase